MTVKQDEGKNNLYILFNLLHQFSYSSRKNRFTGQTFSSTKLKICGSVILNQKLRNDKKYFKFLDSFVLFHGCFMFKLYYVIGFSSTGVISILASLCFFLIYTETTEPIGFKSNSS